MTDGIVLSHLRKHPATVAVEPGVRVDAGEHRLPQRAVTDTRVAVAPERYVPRPLWPAENHRVEEDVLEDAAVTARLHVLVALNHERLAAHLERGAVGANTAHVVPAADREHHRGRDRRDPRVAPPVPAHDRSKRDRAER